MSKPVPVPVAPPESALAKRSGALPTGIEVASVAAAAQAKAAVEARYLMAIQRPRNWDKARAAILAACQRPAFAVDARWEMPRGQLKIDGLSVRFAEEAVKHIGNVLINSTVMFEDLFQRIVTVAVTDLEANVTYEHQVVIEKFVERSKAGDREVIDARRNAQNQQVFKVRATDDEVLMKHNQLVAKARRNGVLALIPADLQEEALVAIRAAQGRMASATVAPAERKSNLERLVEWYTVTIPEADLAEYLGHAVDTMTPVEFSELRAAGQAIKDGETTWPEVLQARLQATKRDKPTSVPLANVAQGYEGERKQPKAETIDMATKPRPVAPSASGYPEADLAERPDEVVGGPAKCPHGVRLGLPCIECQQDAAEEGDAKED